MRRSFSVTLLALGALLACLRPPESPQAPVAIAEPNATPWRLQVLLDSSPSGRRPQARFIEGTVTSDLSAFDLDFTPILGHAIAPGIHVSWVKGSDAPFELTLGDLMTDHEIVTFRGRPVRPDSVVGTWEEILYCCGARGRFTLWRSSR